MPKPPSRALPPAPGTLAELIRPQSAPAPAPPADRAVLASYKIRPATKAGIYAYVRRAQAGGATLTIGGLVDTILSDWLRTHGDG